MKLYGLIYNFVIILFDPIYFLRGIYGYFWFLRDCVNYQLQDKKNKIFTTNLQPMVHDKVSLTPIDTHVFYNKLWCFEHVLKNKPKSHVDVASAYDFSGFLSKIVPVTFIDIRPFDAKLKNLSIKKGSVLDLPYKDGSIESLSCMHVVEHIGLGRYGDPLDPRGSELACKELSRVLAKKGRLYFALPIGRERICFNAHRVHDPKTIIKYFKDLKLISFSVVDDKRDYYENVDYNKHSNLEYGNGLFLFEKI